MTVRLTAAAIAHARAGDGLAGSCARVAKQDAPLLQRIYDVDTWEGGSAVAPLRADGTVAFALEDPEVGMGPIGVVGQW